MFKAQVVQYLSEEDQSVYGTRHTWDRMCELAAARLEELGPRGAVPCRWVEPPARTAETSEAVA